MELKRTVFLLGIFVFGTIAKDDDGKVVVILAKDSFDEDVAKMPHFVMFNGRWDCDDCKKLAPTWLDLAERFNKEEYQEIVVAKVDCEVEKFFCTDGFSKVDNRNCSSNNYGKYDTLTKAKNACSSDKKCLSVYQGKYGEGFSLCPVDFVPQTYSSFSICYGSCLYIKQDHYQKVTKYPTLKFFKSGLNSSVTHRGLQDMDTLVAFIDDQMGRAPTKNTNDLLIEAGCKEWKRHDTGIETHQFKYRWIGSGKSLAKGACINLDYPGNLVPETGITKVYSTIEDKKVRSVDAREGTVSVDFTLTMRWLDPNIKTRFSLEDKENGGIVLSTTAIAEIWTPDMYILNRRSFQVRDEWASLKRSAILTTKEFNQLDGANNTGNRISKTTVEVRYEIKSTVYCDFDHSAYPMDKQVCNLTFGSGSFGAIFVLYDPKNIYHRVDTYKSANFNMSITFFDEKINHGSNTVGINIKMNRTVNSFILKYYVPCIAIVLVSEVSFVIPLTAIPGRVALLVTQFLTLTNLFIYQMSESPSGSALNDLGIYLICSLAFVVGALIEFAIVVLLSRSNLTIRKNVRSATIEAVNEDVGNQSEKNCRFSIPPIHVIDLTAFWLSLFLYLLFNCIYWL